MIYNVDKPWREIGTTLSKKRLSVKLLLPDDVIELILERLPVMSLLRFKSVSKKWKSTVEDRRFQERQLLCRKQSRGPDFLFMSLRDDDQIIKHAPIIFYRSEIVYNMWFRSLCWSICHGSCDSLVCLYDTRVGVVVANPATRWYQTFPLARIQHYMSRHGVSVSPSPKLGFGKDKLNGTYKPTMLPLVRFSMLALMLGVICKAPIAHVCDPSSVSMCILDNSLFVSENNWSTLEIRSLDCSRGNTKTWKKMCSVGLIKRVSFFRECALLPIAILDKTKFGPVINRTENQRGIDLVSVLVYRNQCHIPVCLVFIISGEFSHLCKRVMIAEAETKDTMEEIQTQKKEEEEDEEEGPPPGWESTVLPPPIAAVTTAVNSTTAAEISEMAQMVCGSCRRLLSYPRGTKHVKCSCCQTVNLVLEAYQVGQVKCSNCELLLMYPYGAPSVRCSSCKSVTDIREDNKRPPWSVLQGPLKTFSSVR
ncbi:hypothetical protein HID58_031349 [Brassica napus]|uniref:F-box domain-containing protein n=2 Tax=Brassica napus TaxID=3708 RepID=A0ABQ7XFZ2_BRANA|nr:hypothetical protein HID58_031349 [Brassica napus]